MRTHLFLMTIFLLTFFTSTIQAVTVHVPDDYPTIQAGIDACADGDTVMVRDGTYTGNGNRDIDFMGKALVVRSENGPENCIIDCQYNGRGFNFNSGESSTSIVHGFTITNGDVGNDGGGIRCSSSSPTISNNIITGNRVYMWGKVWVPLRGGGIYYDASSSPTIINNVISRNEVEVDNWYKKWSLSSYSYGGGIYCGGPGGILSNNIISENIASAYSYVGSAFAWGGGIYSNSTVTITNCVVSDNSVRASGTFSSAYGGGIFCHGGDVSITNSIIWNNSWDQIYNYGGNLVVTYSDVQGGYSGIGNIDADPFFMTYKGYDYLLDVGSPCIDAGDPTIEDLIYDWHPSWPNWLPNGPRSDMGAYGGPGNKGWSP